MKDYDGLDDKLSKKINEERSHLALTLAEKDEEGKPKFLPGPYQYEPENEKLLNDLINQTTLDASLTQEEKDKIIKSAQELNCKKDEEGNPIRGKSEALDLTPENKEKYSQGFNDILNEKHTLTYDKIKISKVLLEQIYAYVDFLNRSKKEESEKIQPITLQEIFMLEWFIELVD